MRCLLAGLVAAVAVAGWSEFAVCLVGCDLMPRVYNSAITFMAIVFALCPATIAIAVMTTGRRSKIVSIAGGSKGNVEQMQPVRGCKSTSAGAICEANEVEPSRRGHRTRPE